MRNFVWKFFQNKRQMLNSLLNWHSEPSFKQLTTAEVILGGEFKKSFYCKFKIKAQMIKTDNFFR